MLMRRPGRWLAGSFGVAFLGTLGALEWRRQARPLTPMLPVDGGIAVSPTAELPSLDRPADFAAFHEKLRAYYFAMDDRYHALQHRRTQKTIQQDGAGTVLAEEELVETVRFGAGLEAHRPLRTKNLQTGQAIQGESAVQKDMAVGNAPFVYPYARAEKPGDFAYSFAGFESLDGHALAKVEFVAQPPLGRKLSGQIWADPTTGEPHRFRAKWPAPAFPCDHLEMVVEYGLAETGRKQIQRVATDAGGGFAFVRRRYLVTIAFDDYRMP